MEVETIPTADQDLAEICRLAEAGEKPGPDLLRRIYERSARVRQQILDTHGVVNVGAEIIRSIRDAE